MYKLGILGGMGPEATALFLARVIAHTRASGDAQHIPCVVLNNTKIPDRTRALLGEGESPVPALQRDIDTLVSLGVQVLASPCNTAHAFLSSLRLPEGVTFVNMVEKTLAASPAGARLCVLGTSGLGRARVYERAAENDARFVSLTEKEQALVMDAITAVKAEALDHSRALSLLFQAMECVKTREKDVLFLLSCTELSVLRRETECRFGASAVLDALEVLAHETVKACGYEPV